MSDKYSIEGRPGKNDAQKKGYVHKPLGHNSIFARRKTLDPDAVVDLASWQGGIITSREDSNIMTAVDQCFSDEPIIRLITSDTRNKIIAYDCDTHDAGSMHSITISIH